MWIKDNKVFRNPLNVSGRLIYFSNLESDNKILPEYGYTWVEPEIPAPVEEVKKYSTLKIIRTLGAEWDVYRAMLADAGVLDQFFAANYLSADDPVFMAFIANVPEELKAKLDECIWSEV